MPNAEVLNMEKVKVGEVELPAALFEAAVRPALLHEVATIARANGRAGTRAFKTRSAVSGGGKKPWKQKGTGRARQGSTRAPQWRHGGTVFGPQPKDYDVRQPQSKRRAALAGALSWKLREGLVHVVEEVAGGDGKTRSLAKWLAASGWRDGGALLVHTGGDEALLRAGRNLPDVRVVRPQGLCLYDLAVHRHLVLTRSAVAAMEELWAR